MTIPLNKYVKIDSGEGPDAGGYTNRGGGGGSAGGAPTNETPPSIVGTNRVGSVATANVGAWTNDPVAFAVRWLIDDVQRGAGPSYQFDLADLGKLYKIEVTADNGLLSAPVDSAEYGPVQPAQLVIGVISAPTDGMEGQSYTASWGASGGTPPYTYAVAQGAFPASVVLNASTGVATGTLTEDGTFPGIRVGVTDSSAPHQNVLAPALSIQVTAAVDAPVNTALPAITPSGAPRVDTPLTGSNGTWSNSPTGYAYRWLRNGVQIAGATASTYTPTVADVGAVLSFRVTATNEGGSTPADSTGTPAVLPLAPVNTTAPAAPTGTNRVGQVLTAQNGVWANNPTSYTYQWQRGTTNISGATSSTYTLVAADAGSPIRVVVTAVNAGGSTTANSASTATILPLAPTIATAPTAPSGTARVGQVLTANNGTWNNSPTSYTYQWQRGTTNIGATGSTYTLVEADIGATIRVVVTAINDGGSNSANSASTAAVLPLAPVNTSAPGVPTGLAQVGQTLTAQNGVWANVPTSYTYQWQRGTTNISGATNQTYVPVEADLGATLRVVVTAINVGGSASANSASTATVAAAGSTVQWDSVTAAELAAQTNKIDWCNTVVTAFDLSPNYLKVTRNGTTVYNALTSGSFVASGGNLNVTGDVTDQLTALAADLGSGTLQWRIESAARFATGTFGLTGSGAMWTVPVSFPDPATEEYTVHIAGCTIASPAALPAAPDIELYQINMVNDTAGAQAANFVSPMFGCGFKQGDIPAGTWPYFRTVVGGTVCMATLHSVTSWPDGSMKFCGALLIVPVSVAATSSVAISVRSGGNAPEAGVRTTADLTAPDVNVQMIGVDGLTGTWTASLNDAIATNQDVVMIGNGPAGAIWRIGGEVRDNTNAAHGQLYCWHYVIALNNVNGSLRGLRYLGRVAQPWGDINATTTPSAPAPRSRDATMSLRQGSTVIRAMQGVLTDTGVVGSTVRVLHYGSVFTAGTAGKYDYVQGAGSATTDCVVRVTVAPAYLKRAALVATWDLTVSAGTAPSVDYYPGAKGACQEYSMEQTGERPEIGLLPRWCVQHMIQQDAGFERASRVTSLCGGAWRYNVRQYLTGKRQIVAVTNPRTAYAGLGNIQTGWRYPTAVSGDINNPSPNASNWVENAGHQPAAHYWPYLFTGEPQFLDMQTELAASRVLRTHANTAMQFSLAEPVTSSSLQVQTLGRGVQINGGTTYKGAAVFFTMSNGYRDSAWPVRDMVQAAGLMPDVSPDASEGREYLRDVIDQGLSAILSYRDTSTAQRRNDGLFVINYNTSFTGNDSPWMFGFYCWAVTQQADILPSVNASAVRSYFANFWRSLQTANRLQLAISYRMNAWDGQTLAPSSANVKWLRYTSDDSSAITFSTSDSFGEFAVAPFTTPDANFNNMWAMTPQNGDIVSFAHQESGLPYDPWLNRAAYTVGTRVVTGDIVYNCIANVAAAPDPNPANPNPAVTPGSWQALGTALVNPYRPAVAERKTLYLVNVSGRRFQCALTPGGVPLTVTDVDFPCKGNFGSSGGLTRSAYVWDANGYGPLLQGAINYMAAAGENMSACQTTMATVSGTINYSGNPKYKALGSRA